MSVYRRLTLLDESADLNVDAESGTAGPQRTFLTQSEVCAVITAVLKGTLSFKEEWPRFCSQW